VCVRVYLYIVIGHVTLFDAHLIVCVCVCACVCVCVRVCVCVCIVRGQVTLFDAHEMNERDA